MYNCIHFIQDQTNNERCFCSRQHRSCETLCRLYNEIAIPYTNAAFPLFFHSNNRIGQIFKPFVTFFKRRVSRNKTNIFPHKYNTDKHPRINEINSRSIIKFSHLHIRTKTKTAEFGIMLRPESLSEI